MKRLRCFFRHWGDLHYHKGVEKLTLWQWLYTRRLGIGTAWRLAKLITT